MIQVTRIWTNGVWIHSKTPSYIIIRRILARRCYLKNSLITSNIIQRNDRGAAASTKSAVIIKTQSPRRIRRRQRLVAIWDRTQVPPEATQASRKGKTQRGKSDVLSKGGFRKLRRTFQVNSSFLNLSFLIEAMIMPKPRISAKWSTMKLLSNQRPRIRTVDRTPGPLKALLNACSSVGHRPQGFLCPLKRTIWSADQIHFWRILA